MEEIILNLEKIQIKEFEEEVVNDPEFIKIMALLGVKRKEKK